MKKANTNANITDFAFFIEKASCFLTATSGVMLHHKRSAATETKLQTLYS